MTQPTAFLNLINLKRQERVLADQIKQAQEEAIDYAMTLGATGKVANIEGAQVTFKLITVKPKSRMITALQEDIADIRKELEEANAERIAALKAELESLLTNEDIQELEQRLEEEIASLQGEKKPQIAITLPKV